MATPHSAADSSAPPKKKMKTNSSSNSSLAIIAKHENMNVNYVCPICFEVLNEPYMTKCGHTFCYTCIQKTIEQTPRCPKCSFAIDSLGEVFPNFLLNELVSAYKQSLDSKLKAATSGSSNPQLGQIREFLRKNSDTMSLPELELMISILSTKKDQLEAHSFLSQQQLLREFLQHLKREKDEHLFKLQKESSVIQQDLDRVDHLLRDLEAPRSPHIPADLDPEGENSNSDASVVPSIERPSAQGFNVLPADKSALVGVPNDLPARRLRMHHHFEDLVRCYHTARIDELCIPGEALGHGQSQSDTPDKWRGLDTFSECLHRLTRYSTVRPLSTLNYTTDIYNNSSIVSSIEFDKDQEFFAIAGVTKRIKIYDYNVVLKDMVEIHYPSSEMVCSSKISCISWSAFHKSTLASSDYEGTVIVWDTVTGQKTSVFQEHEKRCWSVDFNQVDTKLIASGSDDARVKLWTVNSAHSVASLEAKANVCCVKFNPGSPYNLAFGSADHCVHYYDLRSTKKALNVLKGHKKAVSYVKFLNNEDLVSASTDSQLKLWNVKQPYHVRSFVGHVNEKNFVGLATDGDYITCGSENNGLYVYYKGLSKSLFQFKFDAVKSFLDRDRKEEDVNEFVSAVSWKQNSNVILAANSQGTIKALELV